MQQIQSNRTPLQMVRAHYDASARGDLTGLFVDAAPNLQWTEMAGFPCAGTWIGPEEITENVFKVLGSEWIGYRVDIETLIDAGDRVVAIGSYHGTYRKTGKPMQARVAHVWQTAGGKIVRFEQFTDTLLVHLAMTNA